MLRKAEIPQLDAAEGSRRRVNEDSEMNFLT